MKIQDQETIMSDFETFVREVAELRRDQEDDGHGEPWTMENDDAYSTLDSLIAGARRLVNLPDFIEPTSDYED